MSFKVGFGRVNANPMMGIEIAGYFKVRIADGILDDLEVNAIALECNDKKIVMLSIDHCGLNKILLGEYREMIAKATGLEMDSIFIAATHTHTGPKIDLKNLDEKSAAYKDFLVCGGLFVEIFKIDEKSAAYKDFLGLRCVDAAVFALADLKPAKMGYACHNSSFYPTRLP